MATPSSTAAPEGRRWRMAMLKTAIFLLVLIFVAQSLRDAVHELERSDWRLDVQSLILSGGLYLLGLVPAGVYWWHLLNKFGQAVGPLVAMRAYFVGHLGKYVPGKAMVVVLRAGIARSFGASAALAGVAVVAETLTMMACGALLSLVLIAVLIPPDWKLALAAALALATGGPTLPPILNRLLRRMQPAAGETPPSNGEPNRAVALNWQTLAVGWFAMLLLWCLLGLSLAALLHGLDPDLVIGGRNYLLATAAVALATVAGFLSLLPGGLLVRELVLLDLLAPVIGDARALVAAVLLRAVWLVCELIAAAVLSGVGRLRLGAEDDHS